jgi:hypothetical protein
MNLEHAQLFEFICDDASYGGIGYWASSADNNPEKQTYSVEVRPEYRDDEIKDKVLTYQDLYDACEKLATGKVSVNSNTKQVCQQIILDPTDDVDYDAEDADCIVQVAMFGEIVFG